MGPLFLLVLTVVATARAQVPILTVDSATQITSTSASNSGTLNPNGLPAAYYVQWGTTTAYGVLGHIAYLPAGNSAIAVTTTMTGLTPSTTYHYQ